MIKILITFPPFLLTKSLYQNLVYIANIIVLVCNINTIGHGFAACLSQYGVDFPTACFV